MNSADFFSENYFMPNRHLEAGSSVIRATQLRGVIAALIKRWYVITAGAIIGLVIATLSLASGPLYESSITIAPSQGASSSDGAGGTLSGLASLAGIGGGGSQTLSPYDQLLLTLKSAELANAVFANKALLREMFPSRWDAIHGVWTTNTSLLSSIAHGIDEAFGVWRPREIGPDDVILYLRDQLKIVSDKSTSVRVISLRTSDPRSSYNIVSALYPLADNLVRQSDSIFISGQVRYLEQRLDTITNAEHRQQLAAILSDYEKRLMLAQGRATYAARVVDEPQIARSPASPRPVVVLLLGGMVGGILAIVVVIFLHIRTRALAEMKPDNLATI